MAAGSVSLLTPIVNQLTAPECKVADMPRMSLNERARTARLRAGFATPQAAADAIGCSRPTVIRWEKDATSISAEYLMGAARAYRVSPDWLAMRSDDDGFPWNAAGGQTEKISRSRVSVGETGVSYVHVEQIDAEGEMGDGAVNEDYPDVIRAMDFTETYIRGLVGFKPPPGRLKLLTGRGNSMVPVIQPGDVVVVDTGCRMFDGDGIYLINTGNGQQIKALQDRGDAVYVVSANAELYPPFPVPTGTLIGGKVYLRNRIDRLN